MEDDFNYNNLSGGNCSNYKDDKTEGGNSFDQIEGWEGDNAAF